MYGGKGIRTLVYTCRTTIFFRTNLSRKELRRYAKCCYWQSLGFTRLFLTFNWNCLYMTLQVFRHYMVTNDLYVTFFIYSHYLFNVFCPICNDNNGAYRILPSLFETFIVLETVRPETFRWIAYGKISGTNLLILFILHVKTNAVIRIPVNEKHRKWNFVMFILFSAHFGSWNDPSLLTLSLF